jgi:hypothetical protein
MTEIVNVSPTLIIGLGGTGSYALQYVKRKIRRRLEAYKQTSRPLPRHIPFIEYLVIDTTAQEEMLEEFVPDEFMNIGRLNVSRIIAELEQGADNHIQNWFPKRLDPGQIDSGAGGVRHVGRLCFFVKQAEIQAAIIGKINTIANYTSIRNFISEHLPGLRYEENSTVDVHIVSSLCGGTGSACLLDTAYLVKHVVADKLKQQPNSSAHLITPEPFEAEPGVGRTTTEYIQANFAVALSEVEHFTQKAAPKPWEVVYRNGTRVSSAEKPFSTAYLLGWKEGGSLSKDHVCEIIGEAIAIKTVHPEGRRIKGIIENFKPHVINTEDLKQKRRTYSSYNARILDLGVDAPLFESATRTAARTLLASLCEEDMTQEVEEKALKSYEDAVFADKMKLPRLGFGTLLDDVRRSITIPDEFGAEVPITTDIFVSACRSLKNLPSSDKKLKNLANDLANKVLVACGMIGESIQRSQEQYLFFWRERFAALRKETDAEINRLLLKHSLGYVRTLLTKVSGRLLDTFEATEAHLKSLSGRNYPYEIEQEIINRSVSKVHALCAERAAATSYGAVLSQVYNDLLTFKTDIDNRAKWCMASLQCLDDARGAFKEDGRAPHSSYTTSFVWTQDALDGLITTGKERLVEEFIKLLEREYRGDGVTDSKVNFLSQLNGKLKAVTSARRLAQEAARNALRAEIDAASVTKRDQALKTVHEFVDLASPPWQIERLGEDVATASVTTCPRDSESGQIMERFGKNINFSRNGSDGDEIMIFRSEHGVSVNHLINFRRCLMAVDRKLRNEGKERINDLCLDPKGWNIATPLPIEREREMLRLYFSLAIHFGVINREADRYTFDTPSGASVELRRHADGSEHVRRYEAFESLLDLDCDGSEACSHFKARLKEETATRRRNERIEGFKAELIEYQGELRQLIKKVEDVPDEQQLEKEIKSIQWLIDDIDGFLRETMPGGEARPGRGAGGSGRDGDAG